MKIRRNANRKLAAIWATAADSHVYSLENQFIASPVPAQWVQRQFEQNPNAQLATDGQGKYTLRLHSNCWYEFRATAG